MPEDAVEKYRNASLWDRYASSITSTGSTSGSDRVYEFHYTTSDNNALSVSKFNNVLLKNEYDSSIGAFVLIFEGEVTEIPSSAFSNNSKLTSITIPEGVTSIGENAFRECSNLNTVILPSSLTTIGDDAFYYCRSLVQITLPESLETIGDYSFYKCDRLTEINMPGNLVSVGYNAFAYGIFNKVYIDDLANWVNVEFEDARANPVYKDGSSTKDCVIYVNGEAVSDLVIPDGVTEINDFAFAGAVLSSVTIPDSVVSIGESSFWGCSSIENITLSANLISIGDYAFSGCALIQSITLPSTLTTIGNGAFARCSSITEITIPDSVKTIGESAFNRCTGLRSLNLGTGVESVGSSAFSSVKEIHITDLSAWFKIDFGGSPMSDNTNLFLNGELITELVIPSDITVIKPYAFAWSQTLISLVIPDNVTKISNNAFSRCDNLESVTFGRGLTAIEDGVFNNLENITRVNITDLTAWCNIDFETSATNPLSNRYAKLYLNGDEVTELVIPSGVTEVKSYSFINVNLTSLVIPEGVVTIGDHAFNGIWGKKSMQSITLPSTLTSIGTGAFEDPADDCKVYISDISQWLNMSFGDEKSVPEGYYYLNGDELTELAVPSGTTEIKPYVFSKCHTLEKVTLPSSLVSIGNGAFSSCGSLDDITLNEGLETVGECVFSSCAMTELTLPSTVTFLGYSAFASFSLETVNVLSSVPCTMGYHVAGGGAYEQKFLYGQFTNNANIYVPAESVTLYKVAAGWDELASKIFARE